MCSHSPSSFGHKTTSSTPDSVSAYLKIKPLQIKNVSVGGSDQPDYSQSDQNPCCLQDAYTPPAISEC